MVETLTALAVGSSGTAATATTAATAATAGLFGAGGAVTTAGLITGGLSLASAGLGFASALGQASALRSQAKMENFNAQQELIRGREAENETRRRLIASLAAGTAAAGAAGADLNSGSIQTAQMGAAADADRELRVNRDNTIIASGTRRMNARALRADATGAVIGGAGRIGGSLFDFVDRRLAIG